MAYFLSEDIMEWIHVDKDRKSETAVSKGIMNRIVPVLSDPQ